MQANRRAETSCNSLMQWYVDVGGFEDQSSRRSGVPRDRLNGFIPYDTSTGCVLADTNAERRVTNTF